MIPKPLEPDQLPDRWDDHVSVYETVFEPFSLRFAEAAIRTLSPPPGSEVLDVAAGSGGAAMALAKRGLRVTAIDASSKMVARISERASEAGLDIIARTMDGTAMSFADDAFDAALSVFGVILFPDAVRGLREMRRVVRPGGRVAIVTWTEPQHYELSAELRSAMQSLGVSGAPSTLPAQLRFREREDCLGLFRAAGFEEVEIEAQSALLEAPSARWIAERLAFAPGMAAQLAMLGDDRDRVLDRFTANVEARQGKGPVRFGGRAFVASGNVT